MVSAASDAQTAGLRQQLESTARKMLSLSTDIRERSHLELLEQEFDAVGLLRDAEQELDKLDLLIHNMRLGGV